MFHKTRLILVILLTQFLTPLAAQDTVGIPQLVPTIAANELGLQSLLKQYKYRVDIRLEELDQRDTVVGEFHLANEVTFDVTGNRREQQLERTSTLKRITVTREDLENFRSLEDSSFLTRDIGRYEVRSPGRELVNGVQCHRLEWTPKDSTTGQRPFSGTVWVTDADSRIVKVSGKFTDVRQGRGVESLFPEFEMSRQQIDGNWFPGSLTATDTLRFSTGPVRIRLTVRYGNYTTN